MRQIGALEYEILIRRAYHCGRGGANGMAEADIYRKLERAAALLKSENWLQPMHEREHEYEKQAYIVANNVAHAITKATSEIRYQENHWTDYETLEELKIKVAGQRDKNIIDEVINNALDVFIKLNLESR